MSVSTNDIKKKITATENMSKITKAMQMVSVAKLGKTENRIKHFRAYRNEVEDMLSQLKHLEHITDHPFVKGHKEKKSCIGCVIITTNRGLVGGYNNNLFKLLHEEAHGFNCELFSLVQERIASGEIYKMYVTGQKGLAFVKNEMSAVPVQPFVFPDEVHYTDILELGKQLMADYLSGEINGVVVVYQDFLSKLSQEATQTTLLPIVFKKEISEEKAPVYEMWPMEKEICSDVLTQYMMTQLYSIYLNASLSEHAARMNTMQNATDNAEDIIKESQLIYNRARQAAITQELNEIVAGANAVN